MTREPFEVTLQVIDALEALDIPHHLGGSFASSVHGIPRQTHDADVVVDLESHHIPELVSRLEGAFYIEPAMVRDAVRRRGSFNLIHLATGFKIDVFVAGDEPFDRSELHRHRALQLEEDRPRKVMIKSPEDTVLRKLQWYEMGGQVSDRQWNDILGLLRTQRDALDFSYLRRWAADLGVTELLESALSSANRET